MTSSFNEKDNNDYYINLNEEEFLLLLSGKQLNGILDYYWNNKKEERFLSIELLGDKEFKAIDQDLRVRKGNFSWKKFMYKVGLLSENSVHRFYLNCDLLLREELGSKVFEQRYDEWLLSKIFIFIKTQN